MVQLRVAAIPRVSTAIKRFGVAGLPLSVHLAELHPDNREGLSLRGPLKLNEDDNREGLSLRGNYSGSRRCQSVSC